MIAVELAGRSVGRIRLRHIPDASGASLVGFISDCVEPGAGVHTDGWQGYSKVPEAGYRHRVSVIEGQTDPATEVFPQVHMVASFVVATTSSDTRELSDIGESPASSVFRPRLDHALGDARILGSALVRFAHPNPF